MLELLETAVKQTDSKTSQCLLVVLQQVLTAAAGEINNQHHNELLPFIKNILWGIVKNNKSSESLLNITKEACHALMTRFAST